MTDNNGNRTKQYNHPTNTSKLMNAITQIKKTKTNNKATLNHMEQRARKYYNNNLILFLFFLIELKKLMKKENIKKQHQLAMQFTHRHRITIIHNFFSITMNQSIKIKLSST